MPSLTINGKTYHPGDEVEIDGVVHRLPKLPDQSASGELSDDDLDAVTGGAAFPCAPETGGNCPGCPEFPNICDAHQQFMGILCFDMGSSIGCYSSSRGYSIDRYTLCAKPTDGMTVSDARLKTDVRPLEGALDTLLALRGVTFAYDAPEALGTRPGEHVGFVAQEVEAVLPTWVHEAGGIKRLQAEGLSFEALAVEAIRELENKNARLSADNDALRARLERLERLSER